MFVCCFFVFLECLVLVGLFGLLSLLVGIVVCHLVLVGGFACSSLVFIVD